MQKNAGRWLKEEFVKRNQLVVIADHIRYRIENELLLPCSGVFRNGPPWRTNCILIEFGTVDVKVDNSHVIVVTRGRIAHFDLSHPHVFDFVVNCVYDFSHQ